jgi:hypothetical protein
MCGVLGDIRRYDGATHACDIGALAAISRWRIDDVQNRIIDIILMVEHKLSFTDLIPCILLTLHEAATK